MRDRKLIIVVIPAKAGMTVTVGFVSHGFGIINKLPTATAAAEKRARVWTVWLVLVSVQRE